MARDLNKSSLFESNQRHKRYFQCLPKSKPSKPPLNPADISPAMRSRILFVDDEPLMREFYMMVGSLLGPEYEVFTAAGGKEGLEFLAKTPVDIVVSDLVMPEMNGHEFMTEVAREHPESMRIVISAHEDQLTVAQCLMFGHRYFNKPFDIKNLASVLKRICHLKHQVGSEKLKRVVSGLGALPTPPRIYLRLTEALRSDFTSMDEVGRIVQEDPGLTLKLLQISNSAYFGLSRRIVTPMEAVQTVGLEILRGLVLCLHAFKFYQTKPFKSVSTSELWEHSFRTAHAARCLAKFEQLNGPQCEETFVSGLLHDIGKLVMAANADTDYQTVVKRSRHEGIPANDIELEIFGATHAQVGAYLLGLWGLPEPVVNTVEMHHSLNTVADKGFTPVTAIHVAQCLEPSPSRISRLDTAYLKRIGVENRILDWQSVLAN
jgi:putative nucleotidyltransferase with HDIG domain